MLEVNFTISHRGCWTYDMMKKFPKIKGSVISLYENKKGYISILNKAKEPKKQNLIDFINWCENHPIITDITLFGLEEKKDHYTALYLMVGQYDKIQPYSILNTLVASHCIPYGFQYYGGGKETWRIPYGFQYYGGGKETWRIIAANKRHLTEVFNRLRSLGPVDLISVKTLKAMPIFMDSPEINLLSNSLTEKQISSLNIAYEKGYYDIPRKNTLDDLAEETGVNKSTFSEHIRRAENKFVEHFIKLLQD